MPDLFVLLFSLLSLLSFCMLSRASASCIAPFTIHHLHSTLYAPHSTFRQYKSVIYI